MITQANVSPPNSVVLLMDLDAGRIPESMAGKLVASTASCVAIGTKSASDGETSVILTDDTTAPCEDAHFVKVFNGVVLTPRKELHLCTVLLESILKLPVASSETKVEIWANDMVEPSQLCIRIRQQHSP
jgi:hypothetical protein